MAIDSPVEKVLEFVEHPDNLAKCSPTAERVVEVRWSGQHEGNSFRLVYRVLGMRFNEDFRVTGFEPPRRHTPHRRFQIRHAFRGCVRGTFVWTFEAEGNETYASLDAAYQLKGGVFGSALDALLIERAIKKDVDQMLENMKLLIVR